MFGLLGGLLGGSLFGGSAAAVGIGSAIGGIASGLIGADAQGDTNALNYAIAKEQMDWQERMRSNAYQATMLDMKHAGLNPMLAMQQGPTSMTGAPNMPRMENKIAAGLNAAAAATQITNVDAQTQLLEAQAMKTKAETEMTVASTGEIGARTKNLQQEFYNIQEKLSNILADTDLKRQGIMTEVTRGNLMDAQRQLTQVEQHLKHGQISLVDAQKKGQEIVNRLKNLEIPGAENTATWEKHMGMIERSGRLAGNAINAIGGVANSARKVLGK